MFNFYSNLSSRKSYQNMLNTVDSELENPGKATIAFIDLLKTLDVNKLLEVGCGGGRIYQHINSLKHNYDYTGIEISEEVIKSNAINYPNAKWLVAGSYDIPVETESIDLCFSFYVLEHLVFPEKAMLEMLRTVKPNGYLLLIFPDFVSSSRFASQTLGFSQFRTAKEKLKKIRFFDAIVSFYDSNFRLPKALKKATSIYGSFPINLHPKCLDPNLEEITPDVDAVYIASKLEITAWAEKKGFLVSFPAGKHGYFADHAFISIQKLD